MALPSKERKNYYFFLILLLVNVILLSIQIPLGQDKTLLKETFLAIFTPLQAGLNWLWNEISNFWEKYFFLIQVKSQNEKLAAENVQLRQENILLKNIIEKLEKEAEIKKRLSSLGNSILIASVIGSDAGNIFQSIIINRGSLHGVSGDMTVLDPEGNLVGRVINPVLPWSCRVQLITDETSGVAVITANQNVSGVFRGDGRGRGYLDYVLITSPEVAIGEEVLTSGLDGIHPAGLKVGRVVGISIKDALFKKIEVEPFFQLNKLKQVAIINFDLKKF
ncbi:MAG: rod shape-determining protein MreC [Candidatus Aminicenantes bacterium]|nr:rod shape-determining protein MreC [Candidatus Aminicenantes bacterium]